MAHIEPRTERLSDGRVFEIRTAQAGEGGAWIDLLRAIDASGPQYAGEPDERDLDPARREEAIRDRLAGDADLLLLAWQGYDAIGYLDFRGYRPRRMAHSGWFHMGVRPSAQHRGVGTALVNAMLAWARAHPRIQKVCLGVFSTNTVALALYRSLGFEEEGRGRRAFRLAPSTYVDDVEMGLFVKPL